MLQYTLQPKIPKQHKKSVYTKLKLKYNERMDENEAYKQLEQEIFALATKYSLTRLRISTINFDRDFRRGVDGTFNLVQVKAIIRVLGKTTKVPIGEGEQFSTYEEALEATKKYWSEYYKQIRAKRSDQEKLAEARRQKRYRERRKKTDTRLKRQQ